MTPAVARLHAEADADYARNQSPGTQARVYDDLAQTHEDLVDTASYHPQPEGGQR